MISVEDALSILERLQSHDIQVWVTGGWGIDALLREETRPHKDLDIIMLLDDVVQMLDLLTLDGFQLNELWSENNWVVDASGEEIPTAFVLQDAESRQIDAHVIQIDAGGNGFPKWNNEEGLIFRMEDLAWEGAIAGVAIRCIFPKMQVVCHSGYVLPDLQIRDMILLHQRYSV